MYVLTSSSTESARAIKMVTHFCKSDILFLLPKEEDQMTPIVSASLFTVSQLKDPVSALIHDNSSVVSESDGHGGAISPRAVQGKRSSTTSLIRRQSEGCA